MKLALIIIFCLIISFGTGVLADTELKVVPSSLTVEKGKTFVLTFKVQTNETIDTIASDLITWDSNIIKLLNVEKGNIFTSWLVWINGTIDNVNGTLKGVVAGSDVSTTTSNDWIILKFKALKEGTTHVSIEHFATAFGGVNVNATIKNPMITIWVDDDGDEPPGGNPPNDPPNNPPNDDPPNDDNTTEPDDNTTEPPDNNTTEPPDDNTTEPPEEPDDNTTEPPEEPDNTTEPPDEPDEPDIISSKDETYIVFTIWIAIAIILSIVGYFYLKDRKK